jgi:hypothetical protein
LRAIERVVPKVLDSLRAKWLGKYQRLRTSYITRMPDGEDYLQTEIYEVLRPEIIPWADSWFLTGRGGEGVSALVHGRAIPEFVNDVVIDTLEMWARDGARSPLKWSTASVEETAGVWQQTLLVEVGGWELLSESSAAFKKRAKGEFEKVLEKYIQGAQTRAGSYGREKAGKEKLSPEDQQARVAYQRFVDSLPPGTRAAMACWTEAGSRLIKLGLQVSPRQFECLAQYQVGGMSMNAIAERATAKSRTDTGGVGEGVRHTDRRTVGEGVRHAAIAVVGPEFDRWLNRRKPGRPRKR